MNALVWTGVNRLEFKRDVDRPSLGDDEVLLRVSHAGICGSDLHIWHGEHPRARPPLIMGHEFSARVEEVGRATHDFSEGDAVVVYPVVGCGQCHLCSTGREHICGGLGLVGIDRDGGMAELVAIPARKVHRLPAGMDMARAALVEPLAVGIHALGRCEFSAGSVVAIVGAGPIGVSIGLAAKAGGARQVLICDVSELRLETARKTGFRAVHAERESLLEQVLDATEGEGAQFVFEATGVPGAVRGLQRLARIGGTVVIVGILPEPIPVDLRDVSFRELTLIGVRHYTPEEFQQAVQSVASGKVDVGPLISEVYPLRRAVEAFERAGAGTDVMKVLIQVGG